MNYGPANQLQANPYPSEPGKRDPEIALEMRRLDSATEKLTDMFRQLGIRLAPITRPEPCKPTEEKLGLCAPQTELGNRIREVVNKLNHLTDMVNDQINLTEI